MWYLGSKNRLSKDLAPIIQSYITEDTKGYLEPFVGGANMIDKIDCPVRIGSDIHPQLIALLQKAKTDVNSIPDNITEEDYKRVKDNKEDYPDWYVGLVGFCATFASKYYGGFARRRKGNLNVPAEGIRNLKKQAPKLSDIDFFCDDYKNFLVDGFVIYCDPPYRGTTKYSSEFNHDEFYEWVREMSKTNVVLVSEYEMPNDFTCIWEKEHTVTLDSLRKSGSKRTERLFIYEGAS